MDARNLDDGFDSIRKRIEATGRPVAGGDTGEHGQPLSVGDWWPLVDQFANSPNGEPIWNVATTDLPTTPDCGAI
ncbi:hypothetical protein MycrhN_2985 [Mycolicibacterium rhodesiae NBB3]|uniref:Uncharacterized protein n=1 Tax=Mycolicibacterium rhodesiae (strain NBB3) TaxID=710685 RepID=G8RKD0_MYCRN|nr:hypothetical protein MycrhN_2985 [Mycolicibacterium rhodesiae NBB3]